MIGDAEKILVSLGSALFVFIGYILEACAGFGTNFQNLGAVALAPFATVVVVTVFSCYYHWKEKFEDHFRLILSSAGFPAFLVGIQGLSKVVP
ncbi:hypothetical protein [uncultured Tateyamaria sp.]|uniref:hypothetical protein n=1 Tax=uncultured Tateyamaria sp. TaxID=455651 RepID=UPI0026330E65|nr:hypothetical protein [uncultured Tateyamaria sp.]